jgi:capsular exopolysaccharide synthesis family protein
MAGEDPGIDLVRYGRLLRRNAGWIVALVAAVAILAGLAALRTPRVYTAEAKLLVEPYHPRVLTIEGVRSEAIDDETRYLRTQYEILRGRALAAQVIRDFGLRHEPLLGGRPVGPDTDWGRFDPGLVDRYLGALGIDAVPGTRLVRVTFRAADPKLAARIANAHAEAFIQQGLRLRSSANEGGLDFLRARLVELKARLEASEAALNDYRWRKGILVIDEKRENVVVEQLADLAAQLSKAEADRLALEASVRTIETQGAEALPEVVRSGVLHELHVHLAIAESEYARVATQFKPTYPAVAELGRKADAIRAHIEAEANRVVESVRTAYRSARDQEERLRARVEDQKGEALKLKDAGVEYAILAREVESNRALYESVLGRMKEMAVAVEVRSSNVSIVDRAVAPTAPSNPPRTRNVLLAAALAAIFGIVVALLREALDGRLKTTEEAELWARLPSLGAVPQMTAAPAAPVPLLPRLFGARPPDGRPIVLCREPDPAVTDSYRQIRTSLLLSRPGGPPRTILVASGFDGEGKTLTTANLAVAFAQLGGSVLVIDADLRRPSCHRFFAVPSGPGLTEVLTGQCCLDDVLRPVDGHRLSVVPAGEKPPNPTELLGSASMRELLADATGRFDHVFLDSPAAFGMADAVVLSTLVDGVVLVARGRQTPRRLLGKLRARFAYARAPLLGVVLNGADDASEPYGAYHATLDPGPPRPPGAARRAA